LRAGVDGQHECKRARGARKGGAIHMSTSRVDQRPEKCSSAAMFVRALW
jgi:hypothetical protein